MIVRHRPRRIIGIGAGRASPLILDTLDELGDTTAKVRLIGADQDRSRELLRPDDPRRIEIIDNALRDISPETFEALGPSDFLLVDSTHVLKTGSDVAQTLGTVLPSLRPGVIINFNQVFYPFEYPREWIMNDNRSWNELYALRAFLAYNSSFEVVFFSDYFRQMRQSLIARTAAEFSQMTGTGMWLRRC
jgi:hypothetical protein